MPNFDSFTARHAEYAVQTLIERMERFEGVSPETGASLEERWNAVMRTEPSARLNMVA